MQDGLYFLVVDTGLGFSYVRGQKAKWVIYPDILIWIHLVDWTIIIKYQNRAEISYLYWVATSIPKHRALEIRIDVSAIRTAFQGWRLEAHLTAFPGLALPTSPKSFGSRTVTAFFFFLSLLQLLAVSVPNCHSEETTGLGPTGSLSVFRSFWDGLRRLVHA